MDVELPEKVWILRLGHRLDAALKGDVISIGWSRARHLKQAMNRQALKDALKDAYPEMYEGNGRALGNAASSAWSFIHGMKAGDLVVVPVDGGFYLAKVFDDAASFDEHGVSADFAWHRKVEWRTPNPVPRSHAENKMQKWMKVRQTCVLSDIKFDEALEAAHRTAPLNFRQTILDAARDAVHKALTATINDGGLEKVIKNLAEADGAVANILPKNAAKEGDVDVQAIYLQGTPAEFVVGYQVKQHVGVTGVEGVRQIIQRMEVDGNIDRGCLITTAKDISDEAKKLAEQHGIKVVAEAELVEWILSAGLASFDAN